jgi:microcystin-dependent protein
MYAGNAAGDDPPDGWLYCNGDTIGQTSGNHTGSDLQNLFNLLSASALWGNSGSEAWASATVKLPDFRSRSPVGVHTGAANSITAGLTARALSVTAGTETHTLTTAELASHSHASTIVASTTGQTASHNITANQSSHTHTGTTNSTTPSATGSTTPGAGGSTTPGATGSTTPGNTGSTDPGDTHTAGNHNHTLSQSHLGGPDPIVTNRIRIGGQLNYGTAPLNDAGAHTHTMPSHSHTSAAHTHTSAAHTHTGAAHTHTSAAHTHAFTTGATDPAITISGSVSLSGTTHTHTLTAVSTGGGTAHTNLSPIIAVNYIIKI